MSGMSGPNTPPDEVTGYDPPTGEPSSGITPPAPIPASPNPANPGPAFAGDPSGITAATTSAATSAARSETRLSDWHGRPRGSGEERNPNERVQGLIAAIGLAVGLLFVVGGGLLNANTPMAGLDPTATVTTVPAKLSISPTSVNNTTCAAHSALATLTLSNSGGQSLDWTAVVNTANSRNVILSTTSDGKTQAKSGHLNGGNTTTIYAYARGGTVQNPITITVTTTATAAGLLVVTITCA